MPEWPDAQPSGLGRQVLASGPESERRVLASDPESELERQVSVLRPESEQGREVPVLHPVTEAVRLTESECAEQAYAAN